jgi:hypothetical protein
MNRENYSYHVDFESMYQLNIQTKTVRLIRRNVIGSLITKSLIPQARILSSDKPAHRSLSKIFYQACPKEQGFMLLNIYSVNNKALSSLYNGQKQSFIERLGEKKINETKLFHGTDLLNAAKIVIQGFNRDYCKPGALGHGVYFARNPCYSAQPKFAKRSPNRLQYMILADVLVGESCLGGPNINQPVLKSTLDTYDSKVDKIDNPSIYAVNKDGQSIPRLLLEFISAFPDVAPSK